MTKIPFSNRDIPPGLGAVKLVSEPHLYLERAPEGFHSGGVWEYQNRIWKPLEVIPYGNADFLVPSNEAVALEALQDLPFFQKNWEVINSNGRDWLVRDKAQTAPWIYSDLSFATVEQIEKAVWEMQQREWELNDYITLGIDTDNKYFVLDLSAAQKMSGVGCMRADNSNYTMRFLEKVSPTTYALRKNAIAAHRDFFQNVIFGVGDYWYLTPEQRKAHKGYKYTYASFNRPLSRLWATLPDGALVHQRANWEKQIPHSWFFTEAPLSDETMYRYELTLGALP